MTDVDPGDMLAQRQLEGERRPYYSPAADDEQPDPVRVEALRVAAEKYPDLPPSKQIRFAKTYERFLRNEG